MKQSLIYKLDLTKIEGDGDFSCPNCGAIISPEDETENVYCILETKVNGEVLEELMVQCNNCASRIRIIGFPVLEMENLSTKE